VANHPIDATDLYGNRIVSIQRNCKIFIGLWITVYYENNDEKKKFDIMKEALRIQQSIDKHWNVRTIGLSVAVK